MPLIGLTRYRVQKWMWMYIFLCVLSSLKSQDNSFTGKSSHKRIKHSATVCTQHASHTKKRMHMRPVVRVYVYVSVAEAYVSKSELQKDSSFHPLTHIFSVQNYRVTLTIIQPPIKLTKAEKDLYSPQLKTSLGKRRKFSQRIGTPHCSERYKYTHIHTHNCTHILTRTHSGY